VQNTTVEKHFAHKHVAQVFEKRFRGSWEAAGAENVDSVARKRVQSILSKHEITPLDQDIQRALDEIVRREQKCTTTKSDAALDASTTQYPSRRRGLFLLDEFENYPRLFFCV
jgi:hypothetical protein